MEKEIILRKFKALPEELRDKVSSLETIGKIEALEKKYGVKISLAFMAFLVGQMPEADLQSYFVEKFDKTPAIAAEIGKEISVLAEDSNQAADSSIRDSKAEEKNADVINNLPPDNTAKMVFSSTDEEEIKSLPAIERQGPSADDYTAQAQAIIKKFGFQDKDEVIRNRLQNFVVGKLRDVRDDIEMLEVLAKSRKIGGMGMEEEKARFLIKLIKEKEDDFDKGGAPAVKSAAMPKIEFPVYQELKEKKSATASADTAAMAGEAVKPMTLNEKREKDGFTHSTLPYQAGEEDTVTKDNLEDADKSEEVASLIDRVSKTPPNLPLERGGKKTSIQDLPEKDEVYPIIEEEDGLPVIRMPEEMMVPPKVLPLQRPAREIQPVVSPKKEETIKNVVEKKLESNITIKQYNNIATESAKQEEATTKTETVKHEKFFNLPPAKPQPYIAPAKTLPPKPSMMSARRPSLDDVKFVRKLVGPVEELETMTIIDFRRISADPKLAAKKIKEKIILLEKELYTKRAEGIAAWHKSEVSRFYRLLGQASMAEGRSIEQIIAERQQAGKPTLTIDEFNAIMELNKELRY